MSPSADPSTLAARVRVVLLDFNGGDTIAEAVRCVVATNWPKDRLDVVCVDNGSTDGSIERIAEDFLSVRIVRNGRNLGFPGNNAALGDLDAVEFVALVNSDAFVDPDWLAPLVERARSDEGIGAVCPKILLDGRFRELELGVRDDAGRPARAAVLRGVRVDGVDVFARCHVVGGGGRSADRSGVFEWLADGARLRVPVRDGAPSIIDLEVEGRRGCVISVGGVEGEARSLAAGTRAAITTTVNDAPVDVLNDVGSWVDTAWTGHERGLFEVDAGQYDEPVEVGTWCGAGVLLRADHLVDVGLFEESFFLYYEDTDLAVRGRGRGWRFVTEPSSIVRHVHSASTVEGSTLAAHHIERNRLLLVLRHAPAGVVVRTFVRHLLVTASYARAAFAEAITIRRRPDPSVARRRLGSFVDALRLAPSTLAARRRIARRRLVTRSRLTAAVGLGAVDGEA